jgi:type IV secretion system protein VirB11
MELEHDLDARDLASLKRALGPLILDALGDPTTIELMLNADGRLWHERLGQRMHCIGQLDAAAAMNIIRRIAGAVGAEVTREQPLLECELPLDGSRLAAQVPPVVTSPTFAIRKPASSIFSIEQYVQAKVMTQAQADVLQRAVADHRNIMVIGGTGSGKTTLINALIRVMAEQDPLERILVIEDTRELQCAADNAVRYKTSKAAQVNIHQLLRTSLRMRPDRILVGEVRGSEALALLMAWNSGHPGGCASIHADNTLAGLSKLAMYVSMDPEAPRHIEPLIGEVVHVLVHVHKTNDGRRVREIREVRGYENGQYITQRIDA